MGTEKTFADGRVLPPYDLNELLLSHEALRMRGQISQDHKRLSPKLDLRAVFEEPLIPNIESERAKQSNISATIHHERVTVPTASIARGVLDADIVRCLSVFGLLRGWVFGRGLRTSSYASNAPPEP
jgi:hypothetical protein